MTGGVLLLHGQPGGAADWGGVLARLRLDAGLHALAIDRPGWDGRSARDLAGNARAALEALDRHGVGRATIVGHSFGAAVAAWMAADHPDRCAALVLVAPAANTAALGPLDRWTAAPGLAEVLAASAMIGLGLGLSVGPVRSALARLIGLPEPYLDGARRALLRPRSWRAYAIEQRALIAGVAALEPRLGTITVPATILTGGRDRVVPAPSPRLLATQIPGARLVVARGAGHLLPQREPAFVAAEILAALSTGAGSTLAGA